MEKNEIFKKFPGEPLKGDKRFEKLYHYTSFDTFVKIWCTKKLKFGITADVNDILEATKRIKGDINQIPLMFAFEDVKNSYKQISFTMDYYSLIKGCMSPIMWGIYGDKRKGVCIEFDYSKLNIPETCLKDIVVYSKEYDYSITLASQLESIKDIRGFVKDKAKEIFFTKHKSWKNEKEFRIMSDNLDFLDITNAITAVYLTSFRSVECICTEKLVNKECEVKYVYFQNVGTKNESILRISDTKKTREFEEENKKSPKNDLNKLQSQAYDHYLSLKHDENASLLKKEYKTT
jgi:hypothetical protein